jgi:hypothetical protein
MANAATPILFFAISVGVAALWNRFFRPVPWRIVALFIAIVAGYEATTLFTTRVDFPGQLAYVAYPWKATGRPPVLANTGIVFTQLAPWTRVARDQILHGEWPLWNRFAGCGTPLLASQQSAIFHPFTLISFLLLPIGKAFTLTASLRLFTILFFTFCLLRQWQVRDSVAIFAAISYAFCVFHVVWLLFAHVAATMMMPVCMAAAQEVARQPRVPAFLLLTFALACSLLGGHPESAFWIYVVTGAWSLYLSREWRALLSTGSAFVLAAALTAFVWLPTVALFPYIDRYGAMRSWTTNPPSHNLGPEWLMTLVAPNILGTPQSGTWHAPERRHPAVVDDYGEIASGYAGAIALALALASIGGSRRRPFWFFAVVALLAFATIAELPLWREFLRFVPLAGVSLQQRLRVVWNLSVCALAVLSLEGLRLSRLRVASAFVAGLVIFIWTLRGPQISDAAFGTVNMVLPLVMLAIFVIAARHVPRAIAPIACVLALVELNIVTWRYNPSSSAGNVYPLTGAIQAMQHLVREPSRMTALGWSFLPETPSYYGLEDIKTNNPLEDRRANRMIRGYLHASDYDEAFHDTSEPFFDYLNVRYLYVPPEERWSDPRFVLRYAGRDGRVFENTHVLPRYFLVRSFRVHPEFGHVVAMTKSIRNFAGQAVVTHIPQQVLDRAPQLGASMNSGEGTVRVIRYAPNRTVLDVDHRGWSLLVSSDVDTPGWRAYWNGQREPTVTVNGAFLGCFIPPGRGTLQLIYRPDAFIHGLRISVAAFIVLLITAGVLGSRRSR